MYIHETLTASVICQSPSQYCSGTIEHLMCEVSKPGSLPVFVGVVYRPPHAAFTTPVDFATQLTASMENYAHKIIMGDYNADQLSSGYDADYVRSLMRDLSLKLVDHGVTHVTGTSATWLDLCMVDESDTVVSWGKSHTPLGAGHHLIFAELDIQGVTPSAKTITTRRLGKLGDPDVQDSFNHVDWAVLITRTASGDSDLDGFYSHFFGALDKVAPITTLKVNSPKHAPWVTTELRLAQCTLRTIYRRYRRNKRPKQLLAYRAARDLFRSQLRLARATYYRSRLENLSPGAMWDELRKLGLLKSAGFPPLAVPVDELNLAFAQVSSGDAVPIVESAIRHLPKFNGPEFSLRPVSTEKVELVVQAAKSNATGADGLCLHMVKPLLPALIGFLVTLFNRSITECWFPATWKKAIIVPINKVSKPLTVNDYRPIALLSPLSKVLERLDYDQLSAFLQRHSVLDPMQCGFRKGHSTSSALLKLLNDVRGGMDRRQVTLAVFFDFSKAFDSVHHGLLLRKLSIMGLSQSAIDWVHSYLSNREQAVKSEGNTLSSWVKTCSGVPQGSVLGPLLFSLFINDLGRAIKHSKHLLFADDLQIYTTCAPSELAARITYLNNDIGAISSWAQANGLRLNLLKTKALILGNNRLINQLDTTQLPALGDGSSVILLEPSVRNLGVVLDSKLTFHRHIASVTSKVNEVLFQLQQLRDFTDVRLRKSLVAALILPYIDYCSVALIGAGVVNDLKLQRLVNKGVRFIYNLPRDAQISHHRRSLGWLSVKDSRNLMIGCLVHSALAGTAPTFLTSCLMTHVSRRPLRGHQGHLLLVPPHRTDAYKHSFTVTAPLIWNSIPDSIKQSSSRAAFRSVYKAHLLGLELANA